MVKLHTLLINPPGRGIKNRKYYNFLMLCGNIGFMLSEIHFGFKIDSEFLHFLSIARLRL